MFKSLLFFVVIIFFTSCGDKNSAFRYFDKEDIETNSVQYTKKFDVLKNNEVEVIFISSYLNKIDNKLFDNNTDSFLISLFFTNSDEQDINENGYRVLLNNNEPILLEKIQKNDERFKKLMMKNYWGNYYLVKFDSINQSRISLELFDSKSSKGLLNFEK
jgi:hypothetical protein